MKLKITKTVVDALSPGQTVTDTQLEGFRVRAGKTAKVYSIQKRIGTQVLTRTIGRHGLLTPDQARERAKRILLELASGMDPLDAKRKRLEKQAITLGHFYRLYLDRPTLKESTKAEIRLKVGRHLGEWMGMPAGDITRQMVLAKHRALVALGPTQAAGIARYARAIFNFGIDYHQDPDTGESLISGNPFNVIRKGEMPTPRRRETLIERDAIRPWFQGWKEVRKDKPTACDCLLLALLLGCRRSEAMRLRWEDLDLKTRTVRFPNTKNGTDHVLPIGNHLASVLEERHRERPEGNLHVFPGRHGPGPLTDPRKAMQEIEARSSKRFMVSDLRRTFASHAKAIGTDYFDVQRLLNHRVKANEATPGYIVMDLDRKRELVQRIEDFFLKAGGLKVTPVIPISLALTEKAA